MSLTGLVVLALAGLVDVSAASAAVRYAAPGGTGADPCASHSEPCTLYVAASLSAPSTTLTSGDVVEMAPGTYSEAGGDLGPENYVQVPAGVTVRGEVGKPRPTIKLETNGSSWGAFFLSGGSVSRLAIENEGNSGNTIVMDEGATAERVLAIATASNAITCNVWKGVVRDTVCINEAGGIAMGASLSSFAGARPITLRNVTAIASGGGSVGMDFNFVGSGVVAQIEGKSVLAKGEATDVIARAGTGATTTVTLDHSDYATTATFGTGTTSVTAAGTNENITAAPSLAADGYHQLAASPTVDKGAVDDSSGALDVDDQPRTIGSAPDIGADELAHSTSTSVACAPAALIVGTASTSTCTATVSDTSAGGSVPSGSISFGSSGAGGFSGGGACALTPAGATQSSCQVIYTATAAGSGVHTITATYDENGGYEGSKGTTSISVASPPQANDLARGGKAPETSIGRKPAKRTRKHLAKFTFSSSQRGSRFECKLDRRPFRRCSSPFKRRVKLGPHAFRVRAVSRSGKKDPTPAVYRWRVLPG